MSPAEISTQLADVQSWVSAGLPARNAFKLAMKGRQYGREALLDAWCWFLAGWEAYDQRAARLWFGYKGKS